MKRRDAEILVLAAAQAWVDADEAFDDADPTACMPEHAAFVDACLQLHATVRQLRESTVADI